MSQPPSSPLRALFSRGAVYTAARLVQLTASFLILPFITRLLGPESFGTVAAALVVLQLLTWIVGLGIPSAVGRLYFDGGEGPDKARFVAGAGIASALALTALVDLAGPTWTRVFADLAYGPELRLAVWAAFPNVVVMAAQSTMLARDEAGRFVGLAALTSIVAQVAGLGALLTIDATPAWYLAGLLGAYTIAALWGIVALRPTLRGSRVDLTEALALALPIVPHSLALVLVNVGDRFVLERLEGLAAVGRYQVAYAVGALGLTFVAALNNTWAPMVYAESEERRWTLLATTTSSITTLTSLTAAALALAAPLVLWIAAPAIFDPADLAMTTAFVAAAALPYVVYLSRVHIMFQEKRSGPLALITPSAAIVNVLLNIWLIPIFGLVGAAVATVATYAVLAVLVHLASRRLAAVAFDAAPLLAGSFILATAIGAAAILPATVSGNAARAVAALALGGLVIVRVARELRPPTD